MKKRDVRNIDGNPAKGELVFDWKQKFVSQSGIGIRIPFLFALSFFLFVSASSFAQTTIWSEDFNSSDDNAQKGSGTPSKWTITPTSGYSNHFEVRSFLIQGRNMDQEGVFTSEIIDISNYTSVEITVALSELGNNLDNGDYIRLYYKLDEGGETLFDVNGNNINDFGSITASTSGLNGSSLEIIIKVYNDGGNDSHRFDDIVVRGTVFTGPSNPVSFGATSTSSSEIDLDWITNSSIQPILIAWSSDGTFGIPANGTVYSNGDAIPGGGSVLYYGSALHYDHTGLSANTQYYYKAWSYDGGEYSLGVSDNATTFLCNAISTLPFIEDFSGGVLPTCWQNVDNDGGGQVWEFDNPGNRTISTTTTANGFAILDSDEYGISNSQDADLISPTFDFSSYSDVTLEFEHYYRHYSTDGTPSSATLFFSTDGGSSWTTITNWSSSTVNALTFNQDISAVAGESAVQFKWNYIGTWDWYWAIDDIQITGTVIGPNLSVSSLNGFGNVCPNVTAGPESFSISGLSLTSEDITVQALNGYSFSTSSGGAYSSSLTIVQSGGSFSQDIFVKFTPTAVANYDGNIIIGGGGASDMNVAATGFGAGSLIPIQGVANTVECPSSTNGTIDLTVPYPIEFADPDYIEISSSLLSNRGTFTLEGWIKVDLADVGNRTSLFGQNDAIEFGFSNSTTLTCWSQSGGSASTNSYPSDNAWHHVAAVGNGTNILLYIDGVEVDSGGTSTNNYSSNNNYNGKIGEGVWDASGGFFPGEMIKVGFWSTALSATEVANLASDYYYYEGTETGLMAGFNFFEGSGTTLGSAISGTDGTFYGTPTWLDDYTYAWTKDEDVSFSAATKNLFAVGPGTYSILVSNSSIACPNTGSWTININDNTSPVFVSAPANVTVNCIDDVPTMTNLSWTDNCAGSGSVAGIDAAIVGTDCNGTITRTWSYTDGGGNTASTSQTITVLDNINPTASNPADITIECISSLPAADISVVTDEADNCTTNPVVAFVSDSDDGNTNPKTITRTYSVTDDCGNSINVAQSIVIEDNTVPVISCFTDTTVLATPGLCGADITLPEILATDNCVGPVDVTNNFNSGGAIVSDEFPLGTTQVIYTATDASGNSNSCSVNVTVLKENNLDFFAYFSRSASLITEGESIVFNGYGSHQPETYEWTFAGGTPASSTSQNPTVTFGAAGIYDVTLKITDACSTEKTFTRSIQVTENPVVRSSGNTTFVVPACVSEITVEAWGAGGAGGGSTDASGFQGRGGAGGGGGAYAKSTIPVTPGTTLNLIVGTGGTGGIGGAGGHSTIAGFESSIFAAGGKGGAANVAGGQPSGGAGGSLADSEGGIEAGQDGDNGDTGFLINSGAGGAGANGGAGGLSIGGWATSIGNPGLFEGGGGSGARTSASGGMQAGGSGANGAIIITYVENDPPSISSHPSTSGETLCPGALASTLTIIATGDAPLSYQWYSNLSASNSGGTLIAGATNTSYTPPTSVEGTLYYYCEVTGVCDPVAVSNVSGAIVVEDNEDPTIICPANITVNNDAGICGAVVNYAFPTISDNCDLADTTQTSGLASGATFPVGTTTNTFEVSDLAGNTATCSFDIIVNSVDTAKVSISASENPICSGGSVTFTASPTNGGVSPTYKWFIDGTEVSGETGTTFTKIFTTSEVVTCEMTSSVACAINSPATSDGITVLINTLPTAGITNNSGTTELTCLTTAINVTATGGDTYLWDGGAATNTASNIFAVPGTYTVTVTSVDGCVDTESITITQDVSTPTEFAVTGGGSYCQGGSGVEIGLSGSETGVTYQLFLDGSADGSLEVGTGAAISFGDKTAAGNYTVVATKTANGCTNNMSGSATITIDLLPDTPVNITASPTKICSAATSTLSVNDPGAGYSIEWFTESCGGTLVGKGTSIDVNPLATTTYYAQTKNTTTNCISATCSQVTVNVVTPTLTLGAMPTICVNVGEAFIPIVSSTGNPTNYNIDYDAAANAAGFQDIVNYGIDDPTKIRMIIPNGGWGVAPGTYNGDLTVKVFGPECTSQAYAISVTITSTGVVETSVSASANPVCIGTPVTFTASAPGATMYRWVVNGSIIPDSLGPTYTYIPEDEDVVRAGAVIVCLTAADASTSSLVMIVTDIPTATISGDTTICETEQTPLTIDFSGSSPWDITIQRDGANDNSITEITDNPYSLDVSEAGDYTISAFSDNVCDGTTSGSATITVESTPVAGTLTKTPDGSSVCDGANVSAILTAGSGGNEIDILEYSIDGGSNWLAYISGTSISSSGLSEVQIRTQRLADYCTPSGYETVSWIINPSAEITLDQSSTEICFGDNEAAFVYTSVTGSPDKYSIDFDTDAETAGFVDVVNADLTGGSITVTVPESATPATYNAVLTVNNSTTGCTSVNYSISIVINPLPATGEIIPD